MRFRYLGVVAGVVAGVAVGLSLDLLGAEREGGSGAVALAKTTASDARRVTLPPALKKRAKLVYERVPREELAHTLRLVGSVTFDADKVADVGGRIEGRVARILVESGEMVKRGAPLVELDSNELGQASAALLSARANLIAAEHHERRETGLLSQQLSSAQVLERARAEVKALRAEVHGAEQRLLAMGVTPEELAQIAHGKGPRHITLRAPIDGEVVARYAVLGQVVSPTESVMRIADLDHVWVELDVFEHDLGHVAVGNEAEIESETYPGKTFRGRVTYVGSVIDLGTRTTHVRVEVENEERRLRPGQFVRARLATEQGQKPTLTVRRSAVLQVEGEPSVFVAEPDGSFVAHPVQLGSAAGERVEVLRGLAEGDTVVTEGAFVLKSELLR